MRYSQSSTNHAEQYWDDPAGTTTETAGTSITLDHCLTPGSEAGAIHGDPLFRNPVDPIGADGRWGTWDDGLRLRADSPCIDAGTAVGAPERDLVGIPREGAVDLGAYEYSSDAAAGWRAYR